MTQETRNGLFRLANAGLGVLLAVLTYLAMEVRADIRLEQRKNAVQDSVLGSFTKDLDFIKDGISDIKKALK